MKAVAYYRVSTTAQGRSGLGLEAQRNQVLDLARVRGLSVLAEFTEVESGKRNARPALAAALHHAKVTGAVLVIAKLDRLSRNAAFLLTLRDSGVRFIAADMPDANDMTVGIMAVMAEEERKAISDRTRAALRQIKVRVGETGGHLSRRSGQTITRLGNPNGAAPLLSAGKGNVAALEAIKARADSHAQDLRPVLEHLQAEGISSLAGIAAALNERGICTPRGGRWHASSVRNLQERLWPTAA